MGPRTLYGGDCDGKFKDARLNGRRPLQIQPLQIQRQRRTGNIAYATDGNCDGARDCLCHEGNFKGNGAHASLPMLPLEADLQDLTVIAYEPAGLGISEGYGPVAAGVGNWDPGVAFVGSEGGFA